MLIRGERCGAEVLVTVDGAPLDWRASLAVRSHSPTGPAWGYGGSGPAQLALAILLAVTDRETAERCYQEFKGAVLAPLEADCWVLDGADVRRWLDVSGAAPATLADRAPPATWTRGDGQPDRQRLDAALDRVLERCRPVEVILFGSAARGELRETSDVDLLVVLADGDPADPRRVAVAISEAIGYAPRADVALAFEADVRRGARRLAGVLRVACEEGVVLYRGGRRHAYAPCSRPPAAAEPRLDPTAIREEADWLCERAREKLGRAEQWLTIDDSPESRTTIAGCARKAVELALQSGVVRRGRRPRAWKDPPGLASEAEAAGLVLPPVDPGALARAANYYAGPVYPFYPSPSADEAFEALELARCLVPWAAAPR